MSGRRGGRIGGRPAGRLALGIDCGTSGVRAALLDATGGAAGFAAATFPAGRAGDPGAWRAALVAALGDLARHADAGAVAAIAVDGTSGTLVALDAAGEPRAASPYDACAAGADLRTVAAHAPPGSITLGATSPLARALALARLPGIERIVHQADWIAALLHGGPPVSDETNALKTGYDPLARAWPAWLAATGLDPALLPEVRAPGTPIGVVGAAAAQTFGLPPGAGVVAGVTDGCAGFLAAGAREPGEAVTSLGSTLTVKLAATQPVSDPARGVYSHRLGDLWLAGGASNSGGRAVAAHFDQAAIERLSARIDPLRPSPCDFHPLPSPGERFPVADPTLAPRVTPRPDDDAAFLHGLLESIARIEAQGYRVLADLGAPPVRSVRTVGGGARNAAWTAIRGRVLGVPVLPARWEEPAFGAAQVALAALA